MKEELKRLPYVPTQLEDFVGITGGNCMQLGLDVFVVVGSSS
jgi:hypothetical protein